MTADLPGVWDNQSEYPRPRSRNSPVCRQLLLLQDGIFCLLYGRLPAQPRLLTFPLSK